MNLFLNLFLFRTTPGTAVDARTKPHSAQTGEWTHCNNEYQRNANDGALEEELFVTDEKWSARDVDATEHRFSHTVVVVKDVELDTVMSLEAPKGAIACC